jgi:pyridoxine/pyridoxamine 5'-phosphate oxidase
MAFGKTELLDYMRRHRLAVVSSVASDGRPQSALVGIAVSVRHHVIFDTVSDSRKHANLERDPRAALVFTGPDERTLQLEGVARLLAINDPEDAQILEVYYAAWPDGRERLSWPKISYWCVAPRWARYSDFGTGPIVETFEWNCA